MRRAIPLVLLAVLPLAGCGGGASVSGGARGMVAGPEAVSVHGSVDAGAGPVVVRLGEDYFRPTVIRGQAGAELTLVLENVGRVAHAFDVAGDGQKVDVVVQPGQRATVHVRVPSVGRLLFFCKFHWSRGMAGYLQPSG